MGRTIPRRRGLTLLELLVVTMIIGVLIGLLLPAVQKVRAAADRTTCANNLRQIGLAVHGFHGRAGFLPPSRPEDAYGTWAVLLLPYLEQDNLYQQWDYELRVYDQALPAVQTCVKTYFCPARRTPPVLSEGDLPDRNAAPAKNVPLFGAVGDYGNVASDNTKDWHRTTAHGALVLGNGTIEEVNGQPRLVSWTSNTRLTDITDGTSNTLLIGEKHRPPDFSGKRRIGDGCIYNGDDAHDFSRVAGVAHALAPTPVAAYNIQFGSVHPGICQFVFCDGSVRPLEVTLDVVILGRLAARADGEAIPDF